ncbi:MAG: hypothetical protein ACYC56_04240 [Candidatus Aquicultor sp.]
MKTKIFFFCLLITPLLSAQNIDSLEAELVSSKKEQDYVNSELNELEQKHKLFQVSGNVKGIYDNGSLILLWGKAWPLDGNFNSTGTMFENGNIFVENPKNKNFMGDSYYGKHFFLYTTNGKTVLGAATLVKYYGDMLWEDKEILDQKQGKAKILNENILIIENKLAKLKSEASLLKSQQLYDKGEYYESIAETNTAMRYSPDNKKIYDLLYNNYLALVSQSKDIESCKNTISLLKTTLITSKYTQEQRNHLENEYFLLCIKVAGDYYKNKLYNNAILYYESAQKFGNNLDERDRKNYSSTYYYQGNNQLEQNLIEDARISYVKAIQIDESISQLVSNQLNSQMKSAFLYTTLSAVLPGIGLTAQGDKRGWIVFGITSVSAIGAIIYHNKAMNTPDIPIKDDNYQRSQRADPILMRNICIGIGAVAYIWGLINTISTVNDYNEKYDLSFNSVGNSYSISMRINF